MLYDFQISLNELILVLKQVKIVLFLIIYFINVTWNYALSKGIYGEGGQDENQMWT